MKTLIPIFILFNLVLTLGAQSIKDKQIEVMKEFNSEIYAAQPIASNANIILPKRTKGYQNKDSLVSLQNYNPNLDITVKPIAYQFKQPKELTKGYLAINKGTINQWNGELGYTYDVDNYFSINGRVLYDEWIDPTATDKYNKTANGLIGMKYYLSDQWYTAITLNNTMQTFGRYGGNSSILELSTDSVGLNNFEFAFEIKSFNSGKKDLNVSLKTDLKVLNILNNEVKENLWTLNPILTKYLGEHWSIHNKSTFNLSNNNQLNNLQTLSNVTYTKLDQDQWNMAIGMVYNNADNRHRFFPYFESYISVSDETTLGLRINENVIYNGLSNAINLNPFIESSSFNPLATIRQIVSIGLNTTIYEDFHLELETKYSNTYNDFNFNTLPENIKSFATEAIDYKNLSFMSSFTYDYTDQISAGIDINYNRYESSATLLNRPEGIIQPFIHVLTNDHKVEVELKGILTTKQILSIDQDLIKNQSGIRKDLSLQVAYSPINRLKIYLNADNMLNDDFQAFNGYDVFGRNLSGGVLFKF